MKRWQTKNDKLMISGLLLLLFAGTISPLDWEHLQTGHLNLSATSKPDGVYISTDNPEIEVKEPKKAKPKKGKKSSKDREEDSSESAETDGTSDKNLYHSQIAVNDTVLEATYETSQLNDKVTIVHLSPIDQTEGTDCTDCRTYIVTRPLNDGNYKNIAEINKLIQAQIKKSQKAKKKTVEVIGDVDTKQKPTTPSSKETAPAKRERDNSRSDIASDHDNDPIELKCSNIRSDDRYTLCAMKELARVANISGDNAYGADELQDLFDKHIFRKLEAQLKDRRSASRREQASDAITDLLEKLDDSNSDNLRTTLTKLQQLPFVAEARQLGETWREMKSIERTNPQRALRLLGEFNNRRLLFQQHFNEGVYDMSLAYENLVDGDTFTREMAMNQLYSNFVDPVTSYRDALWSNDPVSALNGLQSGLFDYNGGYAMRGLRDQSGGSNFFPPLMNGNNGPSSRGFNQRGFPQQGPGGGFYRNANGPIQGRFGPVSPNGPYNNGFPGGVRPNGAVPPLSYNGVGFNNGFYGNMGPYGGYNGFATPGYIGLSSPGIRQPLLNGANYGGGYCSSYGVGLSNPYGYGYGNPNAYAGFGNRCGGFQAGYSPLNRPAFMGGAMPMGTAGMSPTTPRF